MKNKTWKFLKIIEHSRVLCSITFFPDPCLGIWWQGQVQLQHCPSHQRFWGIRPPSTVLPTWFNFPFLMPTPASFDETWNLNSLNKDVVQEHSQPRSHVNPTYEVAYQLLLQRSGNPCPAVPGPTSNIQVWKSFLSATIRCGFKTFRLCETSPPPPGSNVGRVVGLATVAISKDPSNIQQLQQKSSNNSQDFSMF